MKAISQFYRQQLSREDQLALGLVTALILSGFIYMLLNSLTFQYRGLHYLSWNWLWLLPALLSIGYFSVCYFQKIPKTAFLIKGYIFYFITFFAFLTMLNGIQYTPFPPIDKYLVAADHVMHFDDLSLIDWTYAHPALLKTLDFAYHSILMQLLLMPLVLSFFAKKHFYPFLVTSLVAYIMGAMIYYFFPSVGPAGILNDVNFNVEQINLALQFKEIHQFLSVATFDGGMIAFPSFHVWWSVIMIYSLRKTPLWVFIPFLLLNLIAIFATLALGWSFAIDVISGILLAALAIFISNHLLKTKIRNYYRSDF